MNSVMIYTVKRQNSIMTSKSEPVNKETYVPKVIEGFIKGNKKKNQNKKNTIHDTYFDSRSWQTLQCNQLLVPEQGKQPQE